MDLLSRKYIYLYTILMLYLMGVIGMIKHAFKVNVDFKAIKETVATTAVLFY